MSNMKEIKIQYDGKWPNLCSGRLEVWLDNDYYDFGNFWCNFWLCLPIS